MEYFRGQTLRARLQEGPLPLKQALRIACEVVEAVEKAHRAGILHRHIKSANIMLTEEGHAKVMDFGLAKRMEGETEGGIEHTLTEGPLLGTPAYMSPEHAAGFNPAVLYPGFSGESLGSGALGWLLPMQAMLGCSLMTFRTEFLMRACSVL